MTMKTKLVLLQKKKKKTSWSFSQDKDAALTNRKGKETSEKAEEITYVGGGCHVGHGRKARNWKMMRLKEKKTLMTRGGGVGVQS
jgi:hypothetical protein